MGGQQSALDLKSHYFLENWNFVLRLLALSGQLLWTMKNMQTPAWVKKCYEWLVRGDFPT